MSRKLIFSSAAAVLMGGTTIADVPTVAVDIAPVHSLVARVMEGVGTPQLIVQPGASPHEYSLRPSEAAALQDADLVVWMGEDLTPWMEEAVETLAADASVITLLEADGTVLLDFREGALFEAHDHGEDEHHGDEKDHAHDDHAEDHAHDHGETEEHAHEEHEEAHDHDDHGDDTHAEEAHAGHDHDGHDHGAHDPHAWLSPENAATWLNLIAAQLSGADPDNAGTYFANAAAAREELAALAEDIDAQLAAVRGGNFIAFHDAYQYFETAFDLPASGAISLSDASDPSPARVAEIQARVKDESIACVLSEPQFNAGLVTTVMDGTAAKTAVLDPLGSDIAPGAELYPQLLRNLAAALVDCLS
ncbi:zinc ABC transporter substrate-binding protein [uncultured Roseobacter sp.]|uniref:zinc ABC transporter substrate-binding protein n=1 Tax=uncultured Roseobacter sp. TaxID=114847 RepID=UPI002616B72E|nr:zinc ABC transporter substrate-binding protein [uncultured Roseobacter sp.]